MTEAFHQGVGESYGSFRSTVRWSLASAAETPIQSEGLIAAAFRDARHATDSTDAVVVAWGTYDLLRRIHFGLELLLAALSNSLIKDGPATVVEVVNRWERDLDPPEIVREWFTEEVPSLSVRADAFVERMKADQFLDGVSTRDFTPLSPSAMGVAGFALLAATIRQADSLIKRGALANDPISAGVVALLKSQSTLRVADVLTLLLTQSVVLPHLKTTFRKMGQGLACSLRFFPNGDVLYPTNTETAPGFSGDRLSNVTGMLADIGLLQRVKGGLLLTERGRHLLSRLGASA